MNNEPEFYDPDEDDPPPDERPYDVRLNELLQKWQQLIDEAPDEVRSDATGAKLIESTKRVIQIMSKRHE